MSLVGVGILLAVLTAPQGDSLTVSMWAMDAGVEKRGKEKHFDRELEPIKDAVDELPFDTFETVKVSHTKADFGKEIRLPINERYTLYCTPHGKTGKGTLRLTIRVEKIPKPRTREPEKPKPVNAFSTRVEVKPGQMIKFKGLRNGDKELIIVLEAH